VKRLIDRRQLLIGTASSVAGLTIPAFGQVQPNTPMPYGLIPIRLPRGLIPTPQSVKNAAPKYVRRGAALGAAAIPSEWMFLPTNLAYWGNYIYADCVTAEEAFAKVCVGTRLQPAGKLFCSNVEAITWANNNGYLNNAVITDVMASMARSGLVIGGTTYGDGPYYAVNYMNVADLQDAIYNVGPVKIGVSSDYLQAGDGGGVIGGVTPGINNGPQNVGFVNSGWTLYNYPGRGREDHCTSLFGYGSLASLVANFASLGITVNVVSGMPTGTCYAMFCWDSIGIIDEQSMLNMTYEAWVRDPLD
jgi:hypothetical protein